MTAPVYPAITSAEAVALTISNANQLHEVVNGDTETVVETFEGLGSIPSVAKALKDAAAYKVPIPWSSGSIETELLQPRIYGGDIFVPLMAPAPMGVIPDSNWRLYSLRSFGGYNIKNVTSPYTILTGSADNGSILVFDTTSPVTINVPAGITIGANVSYRNKQGGVITITPLGSMTLEGAGSSTSDSTMANSLYIESSTVVVTVGAME